MLDLFRSKRFWATVGNVALVITNQFFPMVPDEMVLAIVGAMSAWIVGETIRPVTGAK